MPTNHTVEEDAYALSVAEYMRKHNAQKQAKEETTKDIQSPWAMRARKAKAEALAAALRKFKATAEDVAEMNDEGWLAAAALAGVNPPSQTTRDMVIGLLSMTRDKGAVQG